MAGLRQHEPGQANDMMFTAPRLTSLGLYRSWSSQCHCRFVVVAPLGAMSQGSAAGCFVGCGCPHGTSFTTAGEVAQILQPMMPGVDTIQEHVLSLLSQANPAKLRAASWLRRRHVLHGGRGVCALHPACEAGGQARAGAAGSLGGSHAHPRPLHEAPTPQTTL